MEVEVEILEEAKVGSQEPNQTVKARSRRPPHNYVAIVRDADVPIETFPLDKLCDQLYDGVVLQKGKRKYWVDRDLNKNCFMVFARELEITWGDTPAYWLWTTVKESGSHLIFHFVSGFLIISYLAILFHVQHNCPFVQANEHNSNSSSANVQLLTFNFNVHSNVDVEVAILRNVCWLFILGKFRTFMLSPNTLYEVSLVALMTESSQGWRIPVKLGIVLPDESKIERTEDLQNKPRGKWINILMGEFTTSSKNIGEIRFSISETSSIWKHGLVVKGFAFQPKN